MDQAKHKINGIVDKINRLLERYLKLQSINRDLEQENLELRSKVKEYEAKMHQFEDQLKTLKIAKGVDASDEKTELKLKINEYIREIDRCIAMLNE